MPDQNQTTTPETETAFVCDCEKNARSACKGESFFREHDGKSYCVLHYPSTDKPEAIWVALKRKLDAKDFNFRGVWFPDFDFNEFEFGTYANFTNATFSEGAYFEGATFSQGANFTNATFSEGAHFADATFGEGACFEGTTFNTDTNFGGVTFSAEANFNNVTFSAGANFNKATFSDVVLFNGTTFSAKANFRNATFSKAADFRGQEFMERSGPGRGETLDFRGTTFSAGADFYKASFKADANFYKASFSAEADFYKASFKADANFYKASFSAEADFYKASFKADADFNSTTFSAEADFSRTRFRAKSYFRGATFSADANFYKASFSAEADFSGTRFRADANFDSTTFSAEADFDGTTFSARADFDSTTFSADANFSEAEFRAKANFDRATFKNYVRFAGSSKEKVFDKQRDLSFHFTHIEKPERVSFHTIYLRQYWFINADCRKFEFTDCEWNFNLKQEIESATGCSHLPLPAIPRPVQTNTERRRRKQGSISIQNVSLPLRYPTKGGKQKPPHPISAPHRLLAIASRQLADNAEANHRYHEASNFRYNAFEARRIEKYAGFVPWRLDWWYWLASGYGERVGRAFVVFVALFALFAFGYGRSGFDQSGKGTAASVTQSATIQPDTVGKPLDLRDAFIYSLNVTILQKPEPKPLTRIAKLLVSLETILGPAQAALLALAVRRRFMR